MNSISRLARRVLGYMAITSALAALALGVFISSQLAQDQANSNVRVEGLSEKPLVYYPSRSQDRPDFLTGFYRGIESRISQLLTHGAAEIQPGYNTLLPSSKSIKLPVTPSLLRPAHPVREVNGMAIPPPATEFIQSENLPEDMRPQNRSVLPGSKSGTVIFSKREWSPKPLNP
ncbi:MAG: hypothetical protein ACAI35_11480 [Candidatus Methylacidiphilales bacterium]|nr:hypothetical protein [Candidatus Methylacidiphilales bacterium]